MYAISGCLLGRNCKYNGGNNLCSDVVEFSKSHRCFIVCPESMSDLPVPRPPAERQGERIVDKEGRDVTEEFQRGSNKAFQTLLAACCGSGEPLEGAILKANSPSCGCGKIYDGTFTGTLTDGDGCFAKMIKEKNVKIVSEKEFSKNGKF